MALLTFLFYAFLAYMLYRVVFGLIIPIVRTTRRVKKSFRHMQEQMNAQQRQDQGYNAYGQQQPVQGKAAKGNDEDYIEFEEIR
jgi:hypothetical protein